MFRTILACAVLSLAAGTSAGGDSGLTAELVGGPRDGEGRLVLTIPPERQFGLSLRLTNGGEKPDRVLLSDYPAYRHVKLTVARVWPDGTKEPVAPWPDYYPLKDMKAPEDRPVTLAPGESVSRNLDVLLREGFFLRTLARSGRRHFLELRRKGLGGLREPGVFELTGSYRRTSGAKPLRTAPLRAVVRYAFPWDDASRRAARADRIVRGTVGDSREGFTQLGSGSYVPHRVQVREVLKGESASVLTFHVYRGSTGPGPEVGGDRLLHLVEVTGKLYLTDEGAAPAADDERIATTRARLLFLDFLANEPLVPDAKTEAAVDALVDRMTKSPEAQREALRTLEAMGNRAVRSLIPHLDDPRKLAEETVTFTNRAEDAFEAVRHYRPVTVGKAVAYLLNQITGEHPSNHRALRIYAHYVPKR